MPGSPFHSDGFNMKGNTGLRVEARLLPDPTLPPAHATLWVQDTDDGKVDEKNWFCHRPAIELSPGTVHWREFCGVRGTVRVAVDPLGLLEAGRIEFRLTRLP